MWSALAEGEGGVLLRSDRVRVIEPSQYHTLRAIVLDAASQPEWTVREVADAVLPRIDAGRRVVEDAGGILDFAPHGFQERFRLPVMAREPGTGAGVARPGRDAFTAAAAVTEPERLAAAERIMLAVFPPARVEPVMRGLIQPPRVLSIKGWCVWLAHRSGVPAGAAYTFHDGTSVGVYQVATLPEHRGNGVARAMMAAILDRYRDVPITLTATDQGRPLYEQLGFRVVDTAIWWVPGPTPDPTGDDTGGRLR
jgi:GNAT superfamily N-acetyltransferase